MSSVKLTSQQWSKILEFLRSEPNLYIGQQADCKRFIEAVLWMSRSGAPWRFLPADYGKWNSVYKRFGRWSDNGVWERMHQYFIDEPDMEYLIIDSTIVRAHPCAAGASGKKGAAISGARQKQGWLQHEDSRKCGWTGQPTEIHPYSRTEP